jgi:hypothetical protein
MNMEWATGFSPDSLVVSQAVSEQRSGVAMGRGDTIARLEIVQLNLLGHICHPTSHGNVDFRRLTAEAKTPRSVHCTTGRSRTANVLRR